jgi:hypothetical protein
MSDTIATIAAEFKRSDAYKDLLSDGYYYHMTAWLQDNFPTVTTEVLAEYLDAN